MYCPKCGSHNSNEAAFCGRCGTKLEVITDSQDVAFSNRRDTSSRSASHKESQFRCPSCGHYLQSFEAICPNCGREIKSSQLSSSMTLFIQELNSLEAKKYAGRKRNKRSSSVDSGHQDDLDKQIIRLIKNYIVPINTEDLFEFLIFACSNINVEVAANDNFIRDSDSEKERAHFKSVNDAWINKAKQVFGVSSKQSRIYPDSEEERVFIKSVNDAWINKAKQVYQRARLSSSNHPKFPDVEKIYFDTIGLITEEKTNTISKKKRLIAMWATLILVFVIGLAILVPKIIDLTDKERIMPFSSTHYLGKNYEDVILELEDLGFQNLTMTEIEILPSDLSRSHGEVGEVSIHGNNAFEAESVFLSRMKIEITYYVVKYTINVFVEFESNFLFSKYDVDLLVNGVKKGTIKHGSSADFRFRIKAGENTISFIKTDDSDVYGSIEIVVDGDTDLIYKITSYKDKIVIEDNSTQT
jgi:hypothetical protein